MGGAHAAGGEAPLERQIHPGSSFWKNKGDAKIMETEILGIILGAVLPLYPILFVIHQRIGRYDEVVEEFKKLRTEHEHWKETRHGS